MWGGGAQVVGPVLIQWWVSRKGHLSRDLKGEGALGVQGEMFQAEGTARAKALREEQQEANVAGMQPGAAEKSEIRSNKASVGLGLGMGTQGELTLHTTHAQAVSTLHISER